MYAPLQDGIEKSTQYVEYTETNPPHNMDKLVYCFWELKTTRPLAEDFHLHAVPDACVDIMFNELDTNIAGVTALRTTYEVLNLGKEFHYVGVQFLPGVWRGNRNEIADKYIGSTYAGDLPLIETNNKMIGLSFRDKQPIVAELVQQLAREHIVVVNGVTARILTHLDDIHSVADMAEVTGVTPRQLQRTLKQATGFAPHDFLKVLRLQQAMKQGYTTLYTDQSHFIRSFRAITGYTPTQYFSKFDV